MDSTEKPVVLIADDESALRLLVRATMTNDEYVLVEAADGTEARRLIEKHRPAVAVLDWHMPGQSGLELCAWVKSDPQLASTRVILLTSRAQQADLDAGAAAGADVYLTKPFSPLELVRAVEGALRGR